MRCVAWMLIGAMINIWLASSAHGHVFVAVPPVKGFSPGMDLLAVAGELKRRGHHVYITAADEHMAYMQQAAARHQPTTTTTTTTSSSGSSDFTFVTYPAPFNNLKEQFSKTASISNMAQLSPLAILGLLQSAMFKPCEALFANATAVKVLQESGAQAVLSFALPFHSDSCGCAVAHMLGVPLILVDGNPMVLSPLNTPQLGSGLTKADLQTWRGYLINMGVFLLKQAGFRLLPWLTDPGWGKLRAQHHVTPLSAVPGHCHPALLLKMTNFVLESPQPLPPGHVMLGPASPHVPRPPVEQQAASPGIWTFLQEASPEAGVVLVGFGSTGVFGNALDHTDYEELAAAFTALAPTRVLWPLSPSNLPDGVTLEQLPLGPNVKVVPWVDYNDVLGHPHTKLFITHFGVHSKMEAAFHGVPTIGVPFQFEQAANGLSLVSLGMGEMSQQAVAYRTGRKAGMRFERGALRDLILQVMRDPKYAEAAGRVSAKMQLYYSFRTPVQRAADEAEVLLAAAAPLGASSGRMQRVEDAAGGVGGGSLHRGGQDEL